MDSNQKLREELQKYKPYNAQEVKDKEVMLKYFEVFDDVLTRNNEIAHFSSSAFVLNKERNKILLVFHNILNSWNFEGGRADGDADLLGVAIKEVKEETGLKNVIPLTKDFFTINILPVSQHTRKGREVSAHLHLNVAYVFEADEKEPIQINEDENSGVKWVDIKDFLEITNNSRTYAKGLAKMKDEEFLPK
ncbi:MAG: ADP-ribose pyrophosphatase [candidate division WS6 bacterium GW2011_GWC1_36_11]|uniref:ADP-ribose pyrophosphatase n=3 Tax=Candidatus Dojkabacteria TaxID=74243 RepID=A0A0G0DRR3_9BACT|nr:MAG: ADP-ribose pyrophosphatase [candidate division WS6 bacterium GW2011_GWC1_36_11]KKQ03317.1 MAG: ADP-ribose pyrophosphatase [candidate division WS6 bacterium GW2011_WS6_36_26]KKQ11840.1 MAG: ADP-ribose pyrophosphatase [candidate division WS6 bacterium GW2011_GWC2_36_7]KKQ16756.1 MAG: ADP-ribose pyrophosphatase [candidate division WS6 bacterium GW2011_GWF1_36_8]HAM37706.1 NUDIX hydrolase [Patescibacteria group bacterium]